MSQLLAAFKNPNQPPPKFHYRDVHEQEVVVNDEVGASQLVVTLVGVRGFRPGKGHSVYATVEFAHNPASSSTPQVAKSSTWVHNLPTVFLS